MALDKGVKPAQQLLGLVLNEKWSVTEAINKPKNATGGFFSQSYVVENSSGEIAFLKAMDYYEAFESDDPAKEIGPIVEAYNFERTILEQCKDKRLSKVVQLIDHGTVRVDPRNPLSVVQYIIFELANGDIRQHINNWESFDISWTLRMIHNVAVGLKQLHGIKVAHQDIKPSNIVTFNLNKSKITDFGRAAAKTVSSPHDGFDIAGDLSYAPLEQLYGYEIADWESRRFGCDMYLFGSLIVFMFTGINMTSFIMSKLDDSFHWKNWSGTYDEALPYLNSAYVECILEIEEVLDDIASKYKDDLILVIKQLCNPILEDRGHPKNVLQQKGQYSFERYISIISRLAKKAEFSLKVV